MKKWEEVAEAVAQGQNRLPSSQLLAAQEKKNYTIDVQLSCCWWGRTQPWLLLWGGKRHLLAAAGSYGKEMWLVVVCRHCWCGKGKGCGSEGGRKKKRKKEEKGKGATAWSMSIRVSRFLYSLLLLLSFFFFWIYFLARPTKKLTFVGSHILINNHFDSNLFI